MSHLHKFDRRGEAGEPAANDDHITVGHLAIQFPAAMLIFQRVDIVIL